MTFEWHEEFCIWPSHDAESGRIALSVSESSECAAWRWRAAADNLRGGSRVPTRWQYLTVVGYADTLDAAKVAAERMGRRMRKGLRWAR